MTTGLAAALLALPQAALADVRSAAFANGADPMQPRGQMFVGATLRLGFGATSAPPQAALRMAGAVARTGEALRVGDGIALSLTRGRARPVFTLGNVEGRILAERAHMSGTTKALVIGGVVLAVGVIAVAIAAKNAEFDVFGEE